MGTCLVLPAAGSGSRFGSATPKQLLLLAGVPMLRRSLVRFVGLVDAVIIPAPPILHADIHTALAGVPLPIQLVPGGATRQASVHAGLRACPPQHAWVLVHDAVRPFVPRRCIRACIAALARFDAAVVAVACTDTVKRVDADLPGRVATTVSRDGLWLAQTPQGLRREFALAAFARAESEGWAASDDVQVVERAGGSVAVVPGDRRNLKITTPDDWALAEALCQIMHD